MARYTNYWQALTYMTIKHGKQKRKSNNLPYIIHPIRVAAILRSFGFSEQKNENLMIAALFHDLIEDTSTFPSEIQEKFNKKILRIVNEVTKPNDMDKKLWLNSFDMVSDEAKILKMADRIDNLIDINQMSWTIEKKKEYLNHATIILNKCGNAHEGLSNALRKKIKKKNVELKNM